MLSVVIIGRSAALDGHVDHHAVIHPDLIDRSTPVRIEFEAGQQAELLQFGQPTEHCCPCHPGVVSQICRVTVARDACRITAIGDDVHQDLLLMAFKPLLQRPVHGRNGHRFLVMQRFQQTR
ncbi:hypothetical protein FNL56_13340 [Tardiphaga sp. vice304]|nr:hypothetical protein FNL56_13340 [Tardiphaga sp. vice304]